MNIFFDFDGVILDSLDIKELGFLKIFNKYKKKDIKKILSFHRKNLGKSRFVKIKYFYNVILDKEISISEMNSYSNQFSQIMRKELNNKSRLIKDSMTYIKNNYKKNNFFIVSGTEDIELKWLCDELQISSYFKEIKGSPAPKEKIVKKIIDENYLIKKESILIGDSLNDYEAAFCNKIKFFGYNNERLNYKKYNYIFKMSNFDKQYMKN